MAYYPIMLQLQDKECLVVGGGRVALRKVISLLRSGAAVSVVSPIFNSHFRLLACRITMIERTFLPDDIKSSLTLVIGATNDFSVNKSVYEQSNMLNIPCNIVDCPEICSFIVPAVIRRGDISVAISTGAKSPRLSRYVKFRIAQTLGPEYATLATYMAEVRNRIRKSFTTQPVRAALWEAIFEMDPLEYVNKHGWSEFRNHIESLIDGFREKAGIS
jgi:siroheme synthase-like protein